MALASYPKLWFHEYANLAYGNDYYGRWEKIDDSGRYYWSTRYLETDPPTSEILPDTAGHPVGGLAPSDYGGWNGVNYYGSYSQYVTADPYSIRPHACCGLDGTWSYAWQRRGGTGPSPVVYDGLGHFLVLANGETRTSPPGRNYGGGYGYGGATRTGYDSILGCIYQHNRDDILLFAPCTTNDYGTVPAFYHYDGSSWTQEQALTSFTGASTLNYFGHHSTVIRTGDSNIIYFVYFNYQYAPTIGVVVMDVSDRSVISHTIHTGPSGTENTAWGGHIQDAYPSGYMGKFQQPSEVTRFATLSNGTRIAQFVLVTDPTYANNPKAVIPRITWTAATVTTPTVSYKNSTIAADADTLEVNGDQVYHVIYVKQAPYWDATRQVYVHKTLAYANDATSTSHTWTALNGGYPVTDHFITSNNTPYNAFNSAAGDGLPSMYSYTAGPAWAQTTWIDWWTERDPHIAATVNIGLSVDVTAVPVGPPKATVNINRGNFIGITLTRNRSEMVYLWYDVADTNAVVYVEPTINLGLSVTVQLAGTFRWHVEPVVNFGFTVTVGAKIVREVGILHSTNVFWDSGYSDDFIDCINVDRVAGGLNPYLKMTAARQVGSEDIAQTHADNMANQNLFAFEDASFPAGYQTWVDRRSHAMNAGGTGSITVRHLLATYNSVPDSDPNLPRSILNDYTVESPQALYDYWKSVSPSTFNATLLGHTELYATLGVSFSPYSVFTQDKVSVWLDFEVYDYEGITGGGGGPTEPTPDPTEWGVMVTYPYWGTTWHEEFLAIANAKRDYFGLPHWREPTNDTYNAHLDVAQQHSVDMAATRVFQHNDAAYPDGWESAEQRFVIAGSHDGQGAENIEFYVATINAYTPANPGAHDSTGTILNDYTFPTPQQAFDAWWYSPGHRQNLIRDWGARQMYSYMGLYYGEAPTALGYPSGTMGWYLTHNFLDLAEVQMEVLLDVNCTFNGALIELLTDTYDVTAFNPVTAAHEALYSVRVTQAHRGDYGCRVSQAHEALLQYSVAMDHRAEYTQCVPTSYAHEADYRIWNTVYVIEDHNAPFALVSSALAALEADYSLNLNVRQSMVAPYQASYGVRQADQAKWDIRSVNTAQAANKGFWSIAEGGAALFETVATLTVNGVALPIADAVVSQSETATAWEARIRLTDIEDYVLIKDRDEVVLTLGGEAYTLIVTGKSINRGGPAQVDVQLSAKSPSVLLDAPFAEQISYTNDDPVDARAAVEAMLGTSITNWDITNWMLPALRISFENVTPLEAAKRLVEAAGAVIVSERNGDLTVRLLYPKAMNTLNTVGVDHTFTDEDDTLSVSEEHEAREEYNLFRISEGSTAFADRMEYEALFIPDGGKDEKGEPTGTQSPDKGTLRVFTSPYRSTFYLINTQSPNTTSISGGGEAYDDREETVQFAAGMAGLQAPIHILDSVEWLSQSLGGLSFEVGSTQITGSNAVNQGYALATIKYKTRAFEYAVAGTAGKSALILLEDLTPGT
jgi:uncharacterized protein YkwD